jgi:hypothetical protein
MNYFQKVDQLLSIVYASKSLKDLSESKGHKIDVFLDDNWVKSRLPFLAVEVNREWEGGLKYEMEVSLKAIDPETIDVVLHLHKKAPFLYMIETDFYSPLLNGFLEWVNGTEITVDQK